jgi:hypothetical protein
MLLLPAACKKPVPLNFHAQSPPDRTPSPSHGSADDSETLSSQNLAASTAPSPNNRLKQTSQFSGRSVFRDYCATPDSAARRELISDLSTVPAQEAVPVVAELVELEGDVDLRVILLDALDVFDGEVPAKLLILSNLLGHRGLPDEVHEAALDALQNIQDARAIPVWEQLLKDPDPEQREVAREMIAMLRSTDARMRTGQSR